MMPSFLPEAIKTRMSFRPKGENGDPSEGWGLKHSEENGDPSGGWDLKRSEEILKQDLSLRSR